MSKEQARCSQEARLRMARELGVRCWQGSSKEGLVCIKHSAWLAGEAEGFHVCRHQAVLSGEDASSRMAKTPPLYSKSPTLLKYS